MLKSNNMANKKKSPTIQLIISTLVVVFLATIIVILVILPAIKQIKNLKDDIQNIEQKSEDQYKKIKLLKKSIAELDTIKEKINPIRQSIIEKNEAINLIQELEDLAIEKKVTQTLTIQEGAEKSFILNFSIRGTFYDCLQYLYTLEQLPFYLIIDSLSWTKTAEQTVSLSFSASVFTK
ncbi:MAG: hypothetical protein A2493_02470 [Candidatus Magasanikbacteria bacterium RIFOXYC12_FULL_33_11]|uniref:Type 4 fimbrial biogenesis protein PilO n=1 Tax=Candidatus Magasanikbacteria bacterium RIFOXYC12_FULL_33_11 TaxID=1798701 RepID=A0A1F6NPW8_9BACT|nr:MAG: hypothetical protein A2493_02470 [Candidatus Magasanikbacteria bacterium RIFOXYC12_FULL_33_11]